jgi:hypothetical protein
LTTHHINNKVNTQNKTHTTQLNTTHTKLQTIRSITHHTRTKVLLNLVPHNCLVSIFLRASVQTKGMFMKNQKFSGTPVKNWIFNSVAVLLKLVKSGENRRKTKKLQTQFCWIPWDKPYNFCKERPWFFLIDYA